jgi:hypothetical protein
MFRVTRSIIATTEMTTMMITDVIDTSITMISRTLA